ncbi:MAG: DEAD/DEAH box helicase [Acidimicrobiia bacterium]|nr:DEAD/DEAH box helicase [Acidimicrobiia bacterium]
MSVSDYLASLPFEADRFQREATDAIGRGAGVVVTAPTGAGKTVIAEAAVHLALEGGGRTFYTTPIKALSNQKYTDLCDVHGEAKVGLLTGDNSVNGTAPIVVMTTEVLRNMIHARSDALDDLRIVVLDEVHFLGDRSRGAVWEEIIIHAPPTAQLVCLSATIANPEELTEWIRSRRGDVELVVEDHRPVPLEPIYAVKDRWEDDRLDLLPLLRDGRAAPEVQRRLSARTGRARKGGRAPRRFVGPRRLETVEALRSRSLTPAIYFIFSRKGCAEAAAAVGAAAQPRSREVIDRVHEVVERHTAHLSDADLSVLDYGQWLSGLERGVAAHHAGMVPAFKEAVEELFASHLIDVVFATETLAVGINMPARTVVLESLTKFTGEQHEMLTASEFTQLTGRAGRRGIDEVGYGVVLHSPWVRFEKVAALAASGASPLESTFRPTYNMAVNLVANHEADEAEELLTASLAQFQRDARRSSESDRVSGLREELATARDAAECERGSVFEYLASSTAEGSAAEVFEALRPGDVIDVPGGRRPGRYVLLRRELGDRPRLHVLSAGGKDAALGPRDLPDGSAVLGGIHWKGAFRPRDRRFRQQTVQQLRRFRPNEHRPIELGAPAPEVAHPVASCPDVERHVEATRAVQRIEGALERLGATTARSLVDEFHAVLALLESRGYVDGWELRQPGTRLRRLYSDRDLLVSESIRGGFLEDLGAAEFAAVCSGFVFEPRAEEIPDSFPTPEAATRGGRIRDLWREVAADERAARLPVTAPPEYGFAPLAYAWAQGVDLDDLIDDVPLSPGDFVRIVRQLLDLVRQIRDAEPRLGGVASAALERLDRGIVMTGGPG